jgi:histone H3/H4
MNSPAEYFRLCSSCKSPLPFGAPYYACSVSTCNRAKMPYTFCSVNCWQAHVPVLRHRDAWAEEKKAPTRAQLEAERAREAAEAKQDEERQSAARSSERAAATAKVHSAASKERNMSEATKEVLIVVSKVKTYIKARSGMNTSDAVAEALSDQVRQACDTAIERAKADGRKTVMIRDVTGSDAAG